MKKVIEGLGALGALVLVVVIPGALWVLAGRPEPGEGFFSLVLLAEVVVVYGAGVAWSLFRGYGERRRAGESVVASFTGALCAAREFLSRKRSAQPALKKPGLAGRGVGARRGSLPRQSARTRADRHRLEEAQQAADALAERLG